MDIKLLLNPEEISDEESSMTLPDLERDSATTLALPGESALEKLPAELLMLVVENLGGHKQDPRSDLAHLCATSKHFADFTRPVQYRNVMIANRDPDCLLLLLRSMFEDPTLGPLLQDLELTITSTDFVLERGCPAERLCSIFTPAQLKDLWDQHNRFFVDPRDHKASDEHKLQNFITVVCKLCTFQVLSQASHLTKLKLTLAATFLPPWPSLMALRSHRAEIKTLFELIEESISSMNRREGSEFLPSLEKLEFSICQDARPRESREIWDVLRSFESSPFDSFRGLASLQAFVVSGRSLGRDNYSSSELFTDWMGSRQQPQRPWHEIKSLDITRFTKWEDTWLASYISPGIKDIYQTFPSLQILAVKGELSPEWKYPPSLGLLHHTSTDLSSGLAKLTQLRNLDLDLRVNGLGVELFNPITGLPSLHVAIVHRQRLGPLGFLSVKDIPTLETIKMPFHAIIGLDESPARLHHVPDPAEVLPKALKSLTIRLDFEDLRKFLPRRFRPQASTLSFDRPWQPRLAALAFLEAMADLGHGIFPHLEEVVYCYSWPRETYCRCYPTEPHSYIDEAVRYYCEYYPDSKYARLGVYGGQNGGYNEFDADVSPDSALASPPLSFESTFDEHGVETNVPARYQALVEKFASMKVKLTVVERVDNRSVPPFHQKPTKAEQQRIAAIGGRAGWRPC